ncbi:unnamed protein product [Phytomonas sp. Hart1]|nr:unnamed protein product [Phytomonas sp. Hart1]|eukprot:CCW69194.1 unnamed protein product [Phytomonas sp. isolate Hart1]
MLRRTPVFAAAEFKQKSRWMHVWPNMHYGAMYLNYSVGRQLPMRSVNWVTRESNRLTNFAQRYAAVLKDLDVPKNEEALHIPLEDIRWNDHRRIYWRCSFCGSSYRKNVSVRTKFHAGCSRCKGKNPSEVLQEQALGGTLGDTHPDLAAQLVEDGKSDHIASLRETSKFQADWICQNCGETYRATIRSRTGKIEPGQCPLHPSIREWSAYCPACTWERNMEPLGKLILREGQYLGLGEIFPDASLTETAKPETIPRRRKLLA